MIDRLIVNILEWAAGHHDEGRYSPVAIVFHWTMAALVIFQLAWGITALQDQQAAGLIMWAPAAAIYLAVAGWLLSRLLRPQAAPA